MARVRKLQLADFRSDCALGGCGKLSHPNAIGMKLLRNGINNDYVGLVPKYLHPLSVKEEWCAIPLISGKVLAGH